MRVCVIIMKKVARETNFSTLRIVKKEKRKKVEVNK
jgi:hypothetical protein